MTIRHTVNEGDSLWSLAHRYLGDGNRWRMIFDHHNEEVARTGPQPYHRLFAIEDHDLIFVGQTLLIPLRRKNIPPGIGDKSKANTIATPVNLKLKYSIGRDTPPAVYLSHTVEFDIKAEITGEITLEMLSASRHLNNLDITLSKNSMEVKQKLRKDYDPAIRELLSKPKVVFESGKVKLKTSLAPTAKGEIGGYTLEVKPVTPNHFSGTLTPPTISGKKKAEGREYKYSADIEFKVDVYSRPKNQPEPVPDTGTVKQKVPQKKIADKPTNNTTRWEETVAEKGTFLAVVTVILYTAYRAAELFMSRGMSPTTIPPFIHEIDHRSDYRDNA